MNNVLAELQSPTSGLRNGGLFAIHELTDGVPRRPDWADARKSAATLLKLRERDLLNGLGFTVEPLPGPAYVLRAADSRTALAILLERDEVPEIANARFSNLSPISYALAKADAENLEYVLLLAGPVIRLYPAKTGVGTGQRGRVETYGEVRLDLLPEDQAGYLWLIFSAAALTKDGTARQILESSKRYAADLGSRLWPVGSEWRLERIRISAIAFIFTMMKSNLLSVRLLVLLAEIINDLLLFVIHPTSNGNEQQAERIKGAWHLGSLPPSSARSP